MDALRLALTCRLRDFTLTVALEPVEGVLALVGPSGAGKSTVLRCIAGLRTPDAGRIAVGTHVLYDGERGIDLPPEARGVGLVFQDYALFPHLSVRANVAFGGQERVDELLERFRIAHLAAERPGTLSGGERQRVAVARALARSPQVLLLDEPLSALDAHTRLAVRAELQDLLAELAIPTIVVTHDFDDAAALATNVGVIVAGALRQVGTARELVARPADPFVAAFCGANLLEGVGSGDRLVLAGGATIRLPLEVEGPAAVALQPWDVVVVATDPGDGRNALRGRVVAVTPHGDRTRVRVGSLLAEVAPGGWLPERGSEAYAVFAPSALRVLPPSDT